MTDEELLQIEAFIDVSLPSLNLNGFSRTALFWFLLDMLVAAGRLEPLDKNDRLAAVEAVTDRLLARTNLAASG